MRARGSSGFGAAANVGVKHASFPFIVLINNDVQLQAGSLRALLDAALVHGEAAIFQPKIRSSRNPTHFDYAGAAGGLLDRLGYPLAFGRLFDVIEEDRGQYDQVGEIHWACGAAMAFWKQDFLDVGGFDEAFYMHMEEIDLAWRLRLRGKSVRLVSDAVAFHVGSYTLPPTSFLKAYLNHRNNWVLLFKNMSGCSLVKVIPARLALEATTVLYGVRHLDYRTPLAALLGFIWLVLHLPQVLARRRVALATRTASFEHAEGAHFRTSSVVSRFVRGFRTTGELTRASPSRDGRVETQTGASNRHVRQALSTAESAPGHRPRLSVIIPTWNEALSLPRLLPRLTEALRGVAHEILVVDDGSPDGTADVAERLSKECHPTVRVVRRTGERGLSRAVLCGFGLARGELVGVMDADLQHDPADLRRMMEVAPGFDVTIGSRYVRGGTCGAWSSVRETLSRLAARVTRRVVHLDARDPLSGFFVAKRQVVEQALPSLRGDGWKVLLDLLAASPDAAIAEVPIRFRERCYGKSKMSSGVILRWAQALLRHRRLRALGSLSARPGLRTAP